MKFRSNLVKGNFDFSRYEMYGKSPSILEGKLEYDTLCPVSKATGHRTNPLEVLGMTFGAEKARLINSVLQELPVSDVPSSDGSSFDMLLSRLDYGNTPAERDLMVHQLYSVADSLCEISPQLKESIESSKKSIDFDKGDAPVVES